MARRDPLSSGSPDTDDFRKNFDWEYLENRKFYLPENSNLVSGDHDHGSGRNEETPRRAVLLIETIFEKTLTGYISRNSKSVWLIIRTLYQENITIAHVARRDAPSSGYTDTDDFREIFDWVYVKKQQICGLKI